MAIDSGPGSRSRAEFEEQRRRYMEESEANRERLIVFLRQALCKMFPDRESLIERDLIFLKDLKIRDDQRDELMRGVMREFNLTSTPYVDFNHLHDLSEVAEILSDYL